MARFIRNAAASQRAFFYRSWLQAVFALATGLCLSAPAHAFESLKCRQKNTTASVGLLNTVGAAPSGGAIGDLGTPIRHGSTIHFFFSDNYGSPPSDPENPYYGDWNDELMTSTPSSYAPPVAPTPTWNFTPITVQSSQGNLNMSFGQTIQSGFSTRGSGTVEGSRYLSFHRGNRWAVCDVSSDCGPGLVCDTTLGTWASPALLALGVWDVCSRSAPAPGNASGMACTGQVDGDPCPIQFFGCGEPFGQDHNLWFDGICRDPTSSMAGSSIAAHAKVKSAAERVEIGELVGTGVSSVTWITNKFVNHSMMAVRYFDPAQPALNDFRPPGPTTNAAEQNVSVLIWGRPNYVGNSAIGARPRLYFAYNRNPKHFGWSPQYYCGAAEPDQFCTDQSLAIPVDGTTGDFANENFFNHFGVQWNPVLGKFVMLYGGNLPQALIDLIHTNEDSGPALETSEKIYYRTASNPWGPWSTSRTQIYDSATDPNAHQKLFDPGNTDPTAIDANQKTIGQEQEPGHLYSFNMIDSWSDPTVDNGQVLSDIYFNVSTWNPYGVQLWKARIGSATPKVRTSAFFSNWYPHGFTMHGSGWDGGGDRVTQTSNNPLEYAIFDASATHVYFTDYRFEIDIYPSDDDLFGLYARWNNTGTFYSMHTQKQGGDGRVHITRVRNNVETELGSFTWTYVQNAWSTWALEVDGDVIRAYIDGVQRAEILDTAENRIISGFPGFWTSSQLNARFDNQRLEACK